MCNSKIPHGPTLALSPTGWAAFLGGVKAGEFGN
ncbi:protein of unknown function DUF397 [Actinobacteria bacterium OK074]|nr:protein of unknown function DUF397 [Actinobacteria bacterium OK074]